MGGGKKKSRFGIFPRKIAEIPQQEDKVHPGRKLELLMAEGSAENEAKSSMAKGFHGLSLILGEMQDFLLNPKDKCVAKWFQCCQNQVGGKEKRTRIKFHLKIETLKGRNDYFPGKRRKN